MNQQKIGRFLKDLRKEKGITQEQAAEYFGVAGRTISRWETGNNMPDLNILIDIASFYNVEVVEILNGERKNENMDDEIKTTLEKVADYSEVMELKSIRTGIIVMNAIFVLLVIISMYKGISPSPLLSMLCAYDGATFISKSKYTREKMTIITGVIFLVATVLNTIVFIIK